MSLARLIYVSENHIDPAQGSLLSQLGSIMNVSVRNNQRQDITGALVFDDAWFIQILEGDRRKILATYDRIVDDDRHSNTSLLELVDIDERLFGNWWMGFATRTPFTNHLFAPFVRTGVLRADEMKARDVLGLVVEVAKLGLRRDVVDRAA